MPRYSSEEWRRISEVLEHVLDLPPESRGAELSARCAGEPVLQAQVEALLAADGHAGHLLDQTGDALLRPPEADQLPDTRPPGTRVGPYCLDAPVGTGGMGIVYRAHREGGGFQQEVALKLLRPGQLSEEARRRFLAERQILARLEHPGIARLVDGGVTDAAEPWFAMEFVRGGSLTAWCDRQGLGVADRLRIFLQVAEAVDYAHRNLVVHRDLKPSNILVTESGQVKLLDFGIAKLLEPSHTGPGAAETRTDLRVMTPEYAAPEQVRGQVVTTATDVHALGLLLYELLAGVRARVLDRPSPAELERVICEVEPPPPSSRAAQRYRREVAGDLDTVVLKAIAKEPERRYPTVGALADDLKRYLAGHPVLARRGSLAYRVTKFVRRNRPAVVAGGLVVLSLVGGVAGVVHQGRVAQAEAARAAAVRDFLLGLFQQADPAQALGRELTARDLLGRGVSQVDSALAQQPALRQEILAELGRLHQNLGLFPQADTLFRRALDLLRTLGREPTEEYAALLTEAGGVARQRGDLARAESLLTAGRDLRERLHGLEGPELAASYVELALLADDQTEIGKANNLARRALAIDRRHLGETDLLVARDLELIGRLHAGLEGEKFQADSAYRAALAIRASQLPAQHPEVLRLQNSLAANLRAMRRYPEAEALHREVLGVLRGVYPDGHPEVASALTDLAIVLARQGKYQEGEAAHREALALRERLLGPDNRLTVQVLNDLGVLQGEAGWDSAAAVTLREAVVRSTRGLGPEHSVTMSALGNLAVMLTRLHRYGEADSVLTVVLEFRRRSITDRPGVGRALMNRGLLRIEMGQLGAAERDLRAAEVVCREAYEDRKPVLAGVLGALGRLLRLQGRLGEAEQVLREGVALRHEVAGPMTIPRLRDERELGGVLLRRGALAAAESVLVPAFAASAQNPGARLTRAGLAALLARVYQRQGRREEAARVARDSLMPGQAP